MKWKATFVLFLIAAGVFAYLVLVERHRLNTADAAREAQNVVHFDREKIEGIIIQNGDDKIDVRTRGDKWRLEMPIKDQADASAVNNLLLDLENWQKEASISVKEMEADKSKLSDFGLAQPWRRLMFSGDKAPPRAPLRSPTESGRTSARARTSRRARPAPPRRAGPTAQ